MYLFLCMWHMWYLSVCACMVYVCKGVHVLACACASESQQLIQNALLHHSPPFVLICLFCFVLGHYLLDLELTILVVWLASEHWSHNVATSLITGMCCCA